MCFVFERLKNLEADCIVSAFGVETSGWPFSEPSAFRVNLSTGKVYIENLAEGLALRQTCMHVNSKWVTKWSVMTTVRRKESSCLSFKKVTLLKNQEHNGNLDMISLFLLLKYAFSQHPMVMSSSGYEDGSLVVPLLLPSMQVLRQYFTRRIRSFTIASWPLTNFFWYHTKCAE